MSFHMYKSRRKARGRMQIMMKVRKLRTLAGSTIAAAILALPGLGLAATASAAASTGPVSGYVFAWRQLHASPNTLLVSFAAKNNTSTPIKKATCALRAKPLGPKLPKPGYYKIAPAISFSLAAGGKFRYIGTFKLPNRSKRAIKKMWLSCS